MSNTHLGGVVVEGEEDEESEEEESSEEEDDQVQGGQPQDSAAVESAAGVSVSGSDQVASTVDQRATSGQESKPGEDEGTNGDKEHGGSTSTSDVTKDTTGDGEDGDKQVLSTSFTSTQQPVPASTDPVPRPAGPPTSTTPCTLTSNDQDITSTSTNAPTPGASAPVECGRQLPRTAWTVGQRKQRNHTQSLRQAYGQRWTGQLQGTQRTFTQVNSATLKTLHSAQEISHHVRVVNDDLRQLTAVLDAMVDKSRGRGRLQFGSVA